MTEEQGRWTIAVVTLIGGIFGSYTTVMVGYFFDALPQWVDPLFLIARLSPLYLGILFVLELCWFLRWRSLGDF
jgi:hypothetical protein